MSANDESIFAAPGRKRYRASYCRLRSLRAFRRYGGTTPLTVAERLADQRRSFPRPLQFYSVRRFEKRDAPMYDDMKMLRCGQIDRLGGVPGIRHRICHQIWLRNYRAYCRDPSTFGKITSLGQLGEDPWRGPRWAKPWSLRTA
jgi:hypothetical protein